ncbi:hypothetical protein ACHAW6_005332 [Cyclotella cf. meneghiniana]
MAFGHIANTSASALLPMMQLRTPAHQTHILPALSSTLLSVRTYADNGYVTIFHEGNRGAMVHDHNDITITSKKPAILQGCRDENGLWHLPRAESTSILCHPVGHCINNIYDLPSTAHLIQYLHAALGFPTKNTLLAAIRNGNLDTFPGLTAAHVMKHFPESDKTQKRHMEQIQQGLQSTKPKPTLPPSTPTPGLKHWDVYIRIYDATKKTMYTDQTVCFPVISQWGHKYIMVAIELDGNYINAKCMRSCKTNDLIIAYQIIHQHWHNSQVIHINWHVLDNEAPCELKSAIHSNRCTIELTPP